MPTSISQQRFRQITDHYGRLRVALLGDFCLDRYLEIDPAHAETSLETGLPVHNVVRVRAQPGAAGTILGNLVALDVGTILPIGFAGNDGEGFELLGALRQLPGVCLDGFLQTPQRRTFTYCKPLILSDSAPPRELNRLDSKNWTATPPQIENALVAALEKQADEIDALIVLEQVDLEGTGVVTPRVLDAVGRLARSRPQLCIVADSRRGLRGYPQVHLKMNRAELGKMLDCAAPDSIDAAMAAASELARRNGRKVFVTLAENGIIGADADGQAVHCPSLPLRGPIDIVGAGDSVTANVALALASGATTLESLQIANAAASIVIHQLGTTGTASVAQIAELLLGV